MLKKPENPINWGNLRKTSFLQIRTNFSNNLFRIIIRQLLNRQLSKGSSTWTIQCLPVLRIGLWLLGKIKQALRQEFLRVGSHLSITQHLWRMWMLNLEGSLHRRISLRLWNSLWLRTSWTSHLAITLKELSITSKCLDSSFIISMHWLDNPLRPEDMKTLSVMKECSPQMRWTQCYSIKELQQLLTSIFLDTHSKTLC